MKAEADRKNNVYLYTTVPVCVNVRIRLAVYSIVVFVSDNKKKKKIITARHVNSQAFQVESNFAGRKKKTKEKTEREKS